MSTACPISAQPNNITERRIIRMVRAAKKRALLETEEMNLYDEENAEQEDEELDTTDEQTGNTNGRRPKKPHTWRPRMRMSYANSSPRLMMSWRNSWPCLSGRSTEK